MTNIIFELFACLVPVSLVIYGIVETILVKRTGRDNAKVYVNADRHYFMLAVCGVAIFALLALFLFTPKYTTPDSRVESAKASLHELLDTLYSTDMYGGSVPFDDVVDDVTDDIYDALSWLGDGR